MKTLNLFKNEITKASRKAAYIALVCVTVAAMLGAGVIFKIIDILDSEMSYTINEDPYEEEYRKDLYEMYKNELDSLSQKFVNAEGEQEIFEAAQAYFYTCLEYNRCFSETELGVSEHGYYTNDYKEAPSYLSESAGQVARLRTSRDTVNVMVSVKGIPQQDAEKILADAVSFDYVKYDESVEKKYVEIIKNNDFNLYLDLEIEKLGKDETLSAETKSIRLEGYETLRKAFSKDLTRDQWRELYSGVSQLSDYRVMINEKKNLSGNPLTDEKINEYKLTAAEIELSVEKRAMGFGGDVTEEKSFYASYTVQAGMSIATILLILMGTLLIAEEIQSGSIKTLIIAPVKRHRIFTAKLLTLATCAVLETVIIYVMFVLVNLIFGFGSSNVVFTFLGKACAINYYVYYFLFVVLSMVKAFVFGVFSLMLSTLLRNVGGALSISLAVNFVIDGIVSTIAMFFVDQVPAMVMRFLPSTNLELTSKVFKQYAQAGMGDFLDLFGTTPSVQSWQFSAIYIVILTAIMIFIGYQSFEKRDIK